jgi:hypothetical protein
LYFTQKIHKQEELFSTGARAIWSLDFHFAIDAQMQSCMHAGNK